MESGIRRRTRRGKRDREGRILEFMIRSYCERRHGPSPLCGSCSELLEYSLGRLAKCPFGEEKKACGSCRIHCYEKASRERIRAVMKYVGPRMVFLMPREFLRHAWGK
jgi:hypothetical protein